MIMLDIILFFNHKALGKREIAHAAKTVANEPLLRHDLASIWNYLLLVQDM